MISVVAKNATYKKAAILLALLLAWTVVLSSGGIANAANEDFNFGNDGAVYSLTNSATGNAIAVFDQSSNGKLHLSSYVFTDGLGTGSNLGSQGALALEGRWLFAVNAGSNSVSVLKVLPYGLKLVDTAPSGGTMPISLTFDKNLLYVLNAGGNGNITGFRLNDNGHLTQIPNSTRPLSNTASGVGPAQVSFSPNGNVLIVTEKNANALASYTVGNDGRASGPKITASHGQTPFGFAFDGNHRLIVSEAFGGAVNGSAASSYWVSDNANVQLVTGSVPTHQTAACWVSVSKDGKYAYTANPTSDSLTGFKIADNGALTPLNSDGHTGATAAGSGPEDQAFSKDGRFLYVLDVKVGKVSAFKHQGNGQLTALSDVAGLPLGSVGLVAR